MLTEVEISNFLIGFDLISTQKNSKHKKSVLLLKCLRQSIETLCVVFQDIGLIYKFSASKPKIFASTGLNKNF